MTYTELNRNQKTAIEIMCLPENLTVEEIAEKAGLSARTIYNYLSNPAFKSELAMREGLLISQATRRLVGLADKSVKTLEEILDHGKITDEMSNKRLAAKALLDSLLKLKELCEIEDRLSYLEKELQNVKETQTESL